MEYGTYTLDDLCEKITDGSHYSPEAQEIGYPMFSVKDMGDYGFDYTDVKKISQEDFDYMLKSGCVPQNGDVLIAKDGSYLKEVFIYNGNEKEAILSSIAIFRVNSELVLPHYLVYFFKLSSVYKYAKKSCVTGSTLPRIILDSFKKIKVKIPKDIKEQQKIVDSLVCIDSKIEVTRRINQELESTLKDLYDYWFVQFDFPNEEGKPYKSSGGEMVWNKKMNREIPKAWGVIDIKDFAKVERGEIITEEVCVDGNVKVVAAGVDYSYKHNESNRDANVITISSSGANAGYINFWREPIYASDCITVQCEDDVDTILCYHMMQYYKKKLNQLTSGSAQPHIYPYQIETLPMIKIPIEYKQRVSKAILSINKKIGDCSKEQEYLQSLRDFLLPMLMNGQIKIKD